MIDPSELNEDSELRITFYLDPSEIKKFNDWSSRLPSGPTGASGGRFTYSFTPTTLGTVAKITDAITGETIDVTDYDLW